MSARQTIYAVIIGVACVMAAFSSSGTSPTATPTAPAQPKFEMKEFLAIQEGMRRVEVGLILYGVEPKLGTKIGDHESYTWTDGSRTIGTTFEKDRLQSKWQLGL